MIKVSRVIRVIRVIRERERERFVRLYLDGLAESHLIPNKRPAFMG